MCVREKESVCMYVRVGGGREKEGDCVCERIKYHTKKYYD